MMLNRRAFVQGAAGVVTLQTMSRIARAQAYPRGPVRMIVPFAPGGQTDTIARLFAEKLTEKFGKQFHVENVPGDGGNIGVGRAARSAADGHTLMVIDQISYVVNPASTGVFPMILTRTSALSDFPLRQLKSSRSIHRYQGRP